MAEQSSVDIRGFLKHKREFYQMVIYYCIETNSIVLCTEVNDFHICLSANGQVDTSDDMRCVFPDRLQ